MTLKKEPWSIAPTEDKGAAIVDANGDYVALFTDYRDAEYVLDFKQTIEGLLEKVSELEDEVARYENTNN
jgi:hypothetical protein